jgi:hypothetical protein
MSKIKLTNMAPNLQEPLLIKGDIDGALVFNITAISTCCSTARILRRTSTG